MSLCYDFEKHMMITFAIVATALIIGLILLINPIHGQTVDELKNQIERNKERNAVLRADYLEYFAQHNVTSMDNAEDVEHITTKDLAQHVKNHILDCQSGEHDRLVEELEKYGKGEGEYRVYIDHRSGYLYTLEDLGDC